MGKGIYGVKVFRAALVSVGFVFLPAGLSLARPGDQPSTFEEMLVHNPYHQNAWSAEQKAVWETIETWNRAFSENDPDTYFTFIADEITLLLPSSPYRVEGKPDDMEEFRFFLNRGATRVGFFQELQPQVTVIGEMAFVCYYSRGFYGEPEGQMATFKETDILKRTPEGWKIIHIHLSK